MLSGEYQEKVGNLLEQCDVAEQTFSMREAVDGNIAQRTANIRDAALREIDANEPPPATFIISYEKDPETGIVRMVRSEP